MFSSIRLEQQIFCFILAYPKVLRQSPLSPALLPHSNPLLVETPLSFCLGLLVGWRAATAAGMPDLGSAAEKWSLNA